MTDYNPIGNNEVDPESPITSSLMIRLRDNPIAIAEGDASAPSIQTPAYQNQSVTEPKIDPNIWRQDGSLDNGSVRLLGGWQFKFHKFVNLQRGDFRTVNWTTPFTTLVRFSWATVDMTSQAWDPAVQIGNTVSLTRADLNQCTFRCDSIGSNNVPIDGWIIVFGV